MDAPATPSAQSNVSGLKFALRAFRYRNYRLVFLGQGISLIGTWLTTTATSWLVLRLARSGSEVIAAATLLGIVRFAAQIPMSALAPFAGVLVDRWSRHTVLVITQILAMLQSAALAWLTYTHRIDVAQLIGLSVFQGLINAFDGPARQAFVVELVETREDLPNAIALNSSMFNGARLIGPAIGGIMIAKLGEAMCFTIDAVSYIAVIAALLMMKLKPPVIRPPHSGAWRDLHEGFMYVARFAPVRALLLLSGLISLTVGAYQTLTPIFAMRVASGATAAAVFGFLGAAVGVGALGGAIYLASRRTVLGLGRVIAIAAMVSGVGMIAFASTTVLWVMLVTAAIAGFGMIVTFAASNTLLQTIVEDEMRGRLMSFFIVAVMGAAPVGSLLSGWIAGSIGEPMTVILSGVASVLGALLFMLKLPSLRAMVHPIYVQRGIIPEVAQGLAAADRVNTAEER